MSGPSCGCMEDTEALRIHGPLFVLPHPGDGDGSKAVDASFDAVFAAEHPKVVRFGYAMTSRSDAQAQDAAQHAFATLFERWETVDNPAGFVRTVAG